MSINVLGNCLGLVVGGQNIIIVAIESYGKPALS